MVAARDPTATIPTMRRAAQILFTHIDGDTATIDFVDDDGQPDALTVAMPRTPIIALAFEAVLDRWTADGTTITVEARGRDRDRIQLRDTTTTIVFDDATSRR